MLKIAVILILTFIHLNEVYADASTVQIITYDEKKSTVLYAKRGYATHIKLGADEVISEVAGGDSEGWMVAATKGTNDIFLKPKSTAMSSNLVVATNKRSYAFELRLIDDKSNETGAWRLTFTYPQPKVALVPLTPAQLAVKQNLKIKELQRQSRPILNTQYSMQVMPNSEDIAPTQVFDDGTFTFIRIPNHREIPSVFKVMLDGTETMVNSHMEASEKNDHKDTIVIHGIGRRFILRLHPQVVGIWNDNYDVEGVAPINNTLTDGVSRQLVGNDD